MIRYFTALFIYIFLFIAKSLSQTTCDSLYLHLYNYELITGAINKEDINVGKLKDEFIIKNLVDFLNTNDFGVFKFQNTVNNHPIPSFLIQNHNQFRIYNINGLTGFLRDILDFRKDGVISEMLMIQWIEAAINLSDLYSQEKDESMIILHYTFGSYVYYIPSAYTYLNRGILKNDRY